MKALLDSHKIVVFLVINGNVLYDMGGDNLLIALFILTI